MEMEKLCERLLAKMETNKEDFLARMDANMKAWREKADEDMKAWREEIRSVLFETTNPRKETMACQEMEAHQEEKMPTLVDMKPEAAQQEEVPVEDAEVMPVGEPRKKRRRDRNQRNKKKRTQGNDKCQRRLAAARRGTSHRAEVARKLQTDKKMPRRATVARRMRDIFRPNTTRRAKVALCKENAIGKVRARDNVVRGTQKNGLPDGDN
jgi:hypothetical protein